MANEEWRKIPGFDQYSASTLGRLRRDVVLGRGLKAGGLIRGWNRPDGYIGVTMGGKKYLLHRLIALTFLGAPSEGQEVAHGDGVRTNNAIANLRWATRAENFSDKKAHGTDNAGERHPLAKLTDDQVRDIRSSPRLQRELAEEYGIHQSHVSMIRSRRAWKHIQANNQGTGQCVG